MDNGFGGVGVSFVRARPLALVASAIAFGAISLTARGALLAFVSGALTSALGYILWYTALKELTATRAAIVQLTRYNTARAIH